jgi:MFS family permease
MSTIPRLLRDHRFRNYWSAATISSLGDGATSVAVPLTAVLALHANAGQVGFLGTTIWLPSFLFALPLGALADRVRRRHLTMIAADLCRCALLLTVTVCALLNVLSLLQLYLVVFGVGTFSVLFNVCDPTVFVSVVPRADYVNGQSLLRGGQALASLGGPSIGGLLVGLLSAPVAVLVDASSYLASAALLSRVGSTSTAVTAAGRIGLMDGLRFIGRTPTIRRLLSATATINFFDIAVGAVLLLYLTRQLHQPPAIIGVILGVGAAGAFLATLVAGRISRGVGIQRVLLLGCLGYCGSMFLVPLAAGGTPLVVVCMMLASVGSAFGRALVNISAPVIFAEAVPDTQRARTRGAYQFVSIGCASFGGIVGGTLGTYLGLRATLWVVIACSCLSIVWLLPSYFSRTRSISVPA